MCNNSVWFVVLLPIYNITMKKNEFFTFPSTTVFPRLDALHILDASAHFDAGWNERNTFQTPSKFNIQILLLLLLTPGTQHTIY